MGFDFLSKFSSFQSFKFSIDLVFGNSAHQVLFSNKAHAEYATFFKNFLKSNIKEDSLDLCNISIFNNTSKIFTVNSNFSEILVVPFFNFFSKFFNFNLFNLDFLCNIFFFHFTHVSGNRLFYHLSVRS